MSACGCKTSNCVNFKCGRLGKTNFRFLQMSAKRSKHQKILKIVFKYTYKQIIFFKNTKPSQKFSSIFNSWSIWIYNIGCASWVEGISKSTTLRIQLWVPSYLVSLISRGTRKSLSSWHLPRQIWTWQFICPCRFVGLPM